MSVNSTSFWYPDFIDTSAWLDHAPFAFWLTSVLRPRSFVELGTHAGYSYFAFCQAVKALGLETRCHAVDSWKGDEHAGLYGEEVFERVWDYNEAHYAAFSRLVRSSFDEALAHFGDASVDLLHIDGRHFYEDVKHDFESWCPKLSEHAVVLFHDTNVRERNFGVCRFWDELQGRYPTFEFLHGHGLGVLGYGSALPADINAFFEATSDPALAAEARTAYARLGAAIKTDFAQRQTHARVTAKLEARDAEAKDLASKLQVQEARADELEVRVRETEAQLAAAKADHEAHIRETEARVAAAEALHEARAAEIVSRDAEIVRLKGERAKANAAAAARRTQITEIQSSRSWRITAPLRAVSSGLRWSLRHSRRTLVPMWRLRSWRFAGAAKVSLSNDRRVMPMRAEALSPSGVRTASKRRPEDNGIGLPEHTDPNLRKAAIAAAEAASTSENWPEAVTRWLSIADTLVPEPNSVVEDRIAAACIGLVDSNEHDRAISIIQDFKGRRGARKLFLAIEGIAYLRSSRMEEARIHWADYWRRALDDQTFAEGTNLKIPSKNPGNDSFVAATLCRNDPNCGEAGARICVYTALFGEYDNLRSPPSRTPGIDFICFSDRPRDAAGWDVRIVDPGMDDPVLQNRKIKILPYQYLDDYDCSLYIDANFIFLGDLLVMFRQWLQDKPFVAWRHPARSDIYEECEAILASLKHEPSAIIAQYEHFSQQRVPRHTGLIAAGFLWRDHRDGNVRKLMELWWDHLTRFGGRDQPGLGYLMWKTGVRPEVMPQHLGAIHKNEFIALHPHKTTTFELERVRTERDRRPRSAADVADSYSVPGATASPEGRGTNRSMGVNCGKFETQLAAANAPHEARAAEIVSRDAEIVRLKGERAKANAAAAARQTQIKDIHSSTSWRPTAPLRFFRRAPKLVIGKLRARLTQTARTVYHRAPLPLEVKRRIKANLFGLVAPALRHTAAYRNRGFPITSAEGAASTKTWWYDIAPAFFNNTILRTSDERPRRDVAAALARMARNPEPPVIVVPVYNAVAETEDCLQSLLRHTRNGCRIIVIDDASPDPRVRDMLDRYRGVGAVEVHRNEENLGFTRTVNRGIAWARRSDVIFLNSDTKVTPGWLRNLRLAAYSGEKVGTATPFSNNAGAFSAPEFGQPNEIPACIRLDDYSRAITQVSLRCYPSVPTGSGFCMYVRRDCIEEVGLLDEAAFPRGYGEENDFCMRAGQIGWSHVIDDATLIYHARSASFGETKTGLMKRGREVIDDRYPEYTIAIRQFADSDQINAGRRQVRAAASAAALEKTSVRPRLLFVISTMTGGTRQTNHDLMTALDDRVEAFVLRCDASTLSLMHFVDGTYVQLEKHRLAASLRAFPHRSDEYDGVIAEWLVRYAIELVHIRHVSWHGLGLVDVAKAIGLPVVFSFHDFYTVCPTVNLLDENDIYCAGRCTATPGQCQHELWREPDFPPLKNAAIGAWREQMRTMLSKCDAFVTTSESAKKVLVENHPFLAERNFIVIPHGRDFEKFERLAEPLRADETLRILFPGNINKKKGGAIIAHLGRLAAEKKLEVHILGKVVADLDSSNGLILHGEYIRADFLEKVRAIKPHIGGVFSIWPETYCHTLTELWASGVPVIGFDHGAVGDRIRESRAGWLSAEPTVKSVLEIIERLRADPEEHCEKIAAVHAWQDGPGRVLDCRFMSHAYFDLYCTLIEGGDERPKGPNRPTSDDDTSRPLEGAAILRETPLSSGRTSVVGGTSAVFAMTPLRPDGHPEGTGYIRVVIPLQHHSLARVLKLSLANGGCNELGNSHVLLIQRDAVRSSEQAREFVACCHTKKIRLIYEIDDDLLHLPDTHPAAARFSPAVKEAMQTIARHADAVIVSTTPLKERMAALNPNVFVVPNALDERLWHPADDPRRDAGRNGRIKILYMGTRTHDEDLALIAGPIRRLKERYGDRVTFTCVGVFTKQPPETARVESVPSSASTYPAFARWMARSCRYDIAVAPLVENDFNRHKSYIKYLDYAICGIAPVLSDIAPYRDVIRHRETGLLAKNDPDSWYESLCDLIEDPALRDKIGRTAQEDVLAHHTLAAQAEERRRIWTEILA